MVEPEDLLMGRLWRREKAKGQGSQAKASGPWKMGKTSGGVGLET